MRLLFVNYIHPDTPHVSGMRLRYFADSLARQGHQVVLLTRTLGELDRVPTPAQVAETLETHDWTRPYHLACAPARRWSLERIRSRHTPRLIRRTLVAWHYLAGKGLFSDWTEGSRSYWPVLAEQFRPQVTWGTFGNVDSWVIAQGIARQAGIPWVMDVKDGWETYIPFGFRRLVARRFRECAGMTANSQFFGMQFERWFPHSATVVYSGAGDCWFSDRNPGSDDHFGITLVGSTYDKDYLLGFIEGVKSWLLDLSEKQRESVVLTYAGGDCARVKKACEKVKLPCRKDLRGYINQEELAALCRTSAVNAYIWSPSGFHHKLIELLCARRPIISFPGEYEEAFSVVSEVNGLMYRCANKESVVNSLESIWSNSTSTYGDMEFLANYSWDGQSRRLEKMFQDVVRESALASL